MGLFSRKKEMSLASDPFHGSQLPFDLKDIPPPPPSLQEPIGTPSYPQGPQMPSMFPQEYGRQPELPSFDSSQSSSSAIPFPPAAPQPSFIPPAPSVQENVAPRLQPEPGFELPDFDDEEIRKLERDEADAKAPEEPLPEKPVLKDWPEKEPVRPFAEYEQTRPPIGKIPYLEEEKPSLPQGDKFLDLKTLFSVKDEIDGLKLVFRGFDETIENYASKAKLEKYHSLGNMLNNIQDKIMMIDSKLFEP
jgi:hypothetical protein